MPTVDPTVEALFASFDDAAECEEWSRYQDLFLPTFLNLDPTAAAPVAVTDLIAFLPRRRQLFAGIGATGTQRTSLEVHSIDTRHVLAHGSWDVLFAIPRDPITPRSSFLLRRDGHTWRIAAYINHQSLAALLGLDKPAPPARPDQGDT